MGAVSDDGDGSMSFLTGIMNRMSKTKEKGTDWDRVRRANEALEKRFQGKDAEVSEKVAMIEEMSYMRNELERDVANLNITYPVNPPFAFVNIVFDQEQAELNYTIKEPMLRQGEKEQIDAIKEKLETAMQQEEIPAAGGAIFGNSAELEQYLRSKFDRILNLYDIKIEERRRPVILYYLQREFLGLGRSDPVLRDPFIEDVSCNGPNVPIYVFHRVFGSMKTNVCYCSDLELNKYIFKLAQVSGKHVSVYQPILDATLTDGSRINLTLGTEVTRGGSTFSIRKFSHDPISPVDLMRFRSISAQQLAYCWQLIENKRSILLSGGTASGKTTLLNALCMFIRPEDKIVSIEDTPEIHIDHTNWIQSVSRMGYGSAGASATSGASKPGSVSLFDLLAAALRQRPEYVIVGEVRGKEAFTLFQAISVGHASMSTIHAGSIDELLHRVENEPMNIPRELFQSLDSVIFMGQVDLGGKRARRIKGVTEILDVDRTSKNLLTNEPFAWNPKLDVFDYSGRSFLMEDIAKAVGKSDDEMNAELKRKEAYLLAMDRKNVTYYKDVSRAINAYYFDPASAMLKMEEGMG